MSGKSYKFKGLCFLPEAMQLKVSASGRAANLSPTHCRFLLALLEKQSGVVTYEELRQSVWANQQKTEDSLKRLIQTTKGDLVKVLKRLGVTAEFIESVAGEGYRLNARVTIERESEIEERRAPGEFSADEADGAEQKTSPVNLNEPSGGETRIRPESRVFGKHGVFVSVVSLFYGLLFWIALLLEIAYRFDFYGSRAMRLGAPLVLWTGGACFLGLRWTENLARRGNQYALLVGLTFFLGSAGAACLALSYFLPNEPITGARFQTQPAFAAFLKNSLIYFLPLGVLFILLPFYRVGSGGRNEKVALAPPYLFGLWLLGAAYSAVSTFYLLDNLLPTAYHGLFVMLAFLRFFVYFGLALACLLWYRAHRPPNGSSETDFKPRNSLPVIFCA